MIWLLRARATKLWGLAFRSQHPRKEAGVVIHVCKLSNVGDIDRSLGLAGCQPSQKHANSRFQERPWLNKVQSSRSRRIFDTLLWFPIAHAHSYTCVLIPHTLYLHEHIMRGKKYPRETLRVQWITGHREYQGLKTRWGNWQWQTEEGGMNGTIQICETILKDQVYERQA